MHCQQELFLKAGKEADAVFDATHVVCEIIAKAGKPFTEGQLVKDCVLRVADILRPEKRSLFNNVSLSPNTVSALFGRN